MFRKSNKRERGQALVIIAFAAIGLFAFSALAIDGSMYFSDKRHAQNAADTAALDAALAYIRLGSDGDWVGEGLDRAKSNGYDDATANADVIVELCSDAEDRGNACDGLPAGADPNEFIQVTITSNVNTYFARVIGITQLTNRVEAVTQVVPSERDEMFSGNAVVGLSPHDCRAVTYQGNADTTITGGGIFVMSDCPDAAFFNNSSAAELSVPSLCAVGGITYNDDAINVTEAPNVPQPGCEPPPMIGEPNVTCSGDATVSGAVMSPGNWTGSFPPSGVTTLQAGEYCVNGDFRTNAGDTLIGSGVLIKMVHGVVRLEGHGLIHLTPPTTGNYKGLLIYMPSATNCDEIVFNGTGDFSLVGSILAPCSHITVNGTGTGGINGQVIGYTVDISGTSGVSLKYIDENNFQALTLPEIKVTD